MDGSGLFVSTCSRRELARRRAATRFWSVRNLVWMTRGAYLRLTGAPRTGSAVRGRR
jgi:hypothetical protein